MLIGWTTASALRGRRPLSAYTLQSSSSVGSGYTNAGLPLVIEGNEHVAQDIPATDMRFYRLAK